MTSVNPPPTQALLIVGMQRLETALSEVDMLQTALSEVGTHPIRVNDWKRRFTGVQAGLGEAHVRGALTIPEPPPVLVMVYAQQQVEKAHSFASTFHSSTVLALRMYFHFLPGRSTRICQTSSRTPSASCLQASSRKLSASSIPRA